MQKSLYFQVKGPKLIVRDIEKQYGGCGWVEELFTVLLQEMMIEILNSSSLIVNLSWQSCVGMVKSRSSCSSLCTRS